jgi:hypothetical protein
MNNTGTDRVEELCSLIAREKEQQRFLTFVEELSQILSSKSPRLENDKSNDAGRA